MGGNYRKQRQTKTKAPKESNEPQTFDEFIDAAIEFEDQGERYISGDRAQRNYERAVTMYCKAHELNKTDPDCLYNWGRVLFVLINFMPSHARPEDKLAKIDESLEKFRGALQLKEDLIDALFNVGQALLLRSEVVQETDMDNAIQLAAIALQEAIAVFERVYNLQEKLYLEHKTVAESGEPAQDTCMDTDEMPAIHGGDSQTLQDPITPLALIETLLAAAETETSMGTLLASHDSANELFKRAQAKFALAEKWLCETPSQSKEYKDGKIQIHLKEAQTLSTIADRSYLASGQVDHTLFRRAAEHLDTIIDNLNPGHVEAMCDRGDVLVSYAQALADYAEKNKTPLVPETTGKEVWQLYSMATKSFQGALNLEPRNLNILVKLGEVSIARAKLTLPVADRNRAQLVQNAEVYFKHAVETNNTIVPGGRIGWALSVWLQHSWLGTHGKEEEALKIIRTWSRQGLTADMLHHAANDSDIIEDGFIQWVEKQGVFAS